MSSSGGPNPNILVGEKMCERCSFFITVINDEILYGMVPGIIDPYTGSISSWSFHTTGMKKMMRKNANPMGILMNTTDAMSNPMVIHSVNTLAGDHVANKLLVTSPLGAIRGPPLL